MKKLFFSLLIFCASCKSKTEKPVATPTVSMEQQQLEKIKQYPDSVLLKENLLQYYREQNQYTKAINYIDAQIAKDTANAHFYDIKGILLLETGDSSGAINAYEKAVDIYPDPIYVIALATLYAQTHNPLALEMADALLYADKAHADRHAYFIKGLYYSYNKQSAKAIPFFDKCLAISYTDMDAYLEKSIALYDLQKYKEAVDVLDKAIALQNNFDAAYYYKGRALEKLNKNAEAIDAYRLALLYDSQYTEAQEALNRLTAKAN